METVHKKFNISFTNKTDFHFYPRDVLAAVRACAIREGAICSKNSKIHIVDAISSPKNATLLRSPSSRLWLLLFVDLKG
jgi:hypothetical protein